METLRFSLSPALRYTLNTVKGTGFSSTRTRNALRRWPRSRESRDAPHTSSAWRRSLVIGNSRKLFGKVLEEMQPLGASLGLVNCVPDQGASKPTGATQPQDKGPAKATMSKGEAERATSVGRGERIKEVLDFDWKLLVRSRAPACLSPVLHTHTPTHSPLTRPTILVHPVERQG